jgi:hypothetical protein
VVIEPSGLTRIAGAVVFLTIALATSLEAQAGKVDVTLSGEVRVRSELDARTAGDGSDHATLIRTRLGAMAVPSPEVSVFFQVSDSRAFGEESNTLTDATADRLDLHQAWLAWTPQSNLTVKVGRQELALGDERLVGTVGWANVTRAFDGIRANLVSGGWTLSGFAMLLDEQAALLATGLDPRNNAGSTADRALYGLWATSGAVDVFALSDINATDGPDRMDIDRYTFGARGHRQVGSIALEATAALQIGEQTQPGISRQDISAYMGSASANYVLGGATRGRVGVQADYLSGDQTPLDDSFGSFNTLYATNHKFYGFMDLFLNLPGQTGDLGLVDLMVRGVLQPNVWTVRVDLHQLMLAEDNAAGDRTIGHELDITASRALAKGLVFQAGYSMFAPSDAGEIAPINLSNDTLHWAYLQLRAWF